MRPLVLAIGLPRLSIVSALRSEAFYESADEPNDLVARAKAGDPAVWSRWHDEYYPVLYRYAAARLRSPEDAEDVASQVFAEAIRGIGRYSDRGKPVLAWLYGIARHLVSHHYREAAKNARLEVIREGEPSETVGGLESTLSRLELSLALERLKEEHREVLVLRFIVDLPTKQVAKAIGKTEAATYSLQVRAVEALRRELSR